MKQDKSYKVHSMVAPVIKQTCLGTPQVLDDVIPLIHGLTYFQLPIFFHLR